MPENIAFTEQGRERFAFVGDEQTRKTIWHRLGHAVDAEALRDADSPAQAMIEQALIDYEVGTVPVLAKVPGPDGSERLVDVPMGRAIIIKSSGKVLAVTGSGYVPLQNADIFMPLDSLIRAGHLFPETMGALDEGRVVFGLFRLLGGDVKIETLDGRTETLLAYWLAVGDHSGKRSARAHDTDVRVVCANTLRAADQGAKKTGFSVVHRGDPAAEFAAGVSELEASLDRFKARAEVNRWMAQAAVSAGAAELQFEALVPDPPAKAGETARNGVAARKREALMELFTDGRGNVGVSQWDWLNAATEFADHHWRTPGNNDMRRGMSVFAGAAARFKSRAWDIMDAQYRIGMGEPVGKIGDNAPDYVRGALHRLGA